MSSAILAGVDVFNRHCHILAYILAATYRNSLTMDESTTAPSSSKPGKYSREIKATYAAPNLGNLPTAEEVNQDLAAAEEALFASSRPGDEWLKRFNNGEIPSVEDADTLHAALETFKPVLDPATHRVNAGYAARIKDLETKLDEAHQRSFESESHLQSALADAKKLRRQRDEAMGKLESSPAAAAKAQRLADEAMCEDHLDSKFAEQARELARVAEITDRTRKSKLEGNAESFARVAETNEQEELRRLQGQVDKLQAKIDALPTEE
jgi:hypothetical protein